MMERTYRRRLDHIEASQVAARRATVSSSMSSRVVDCMRASFTGVDHGVDGRSCQSRGPGVRRSRTRYRRPLVDQVVRRSLSIRRLSAAGWRTMPRFKVPRGFDDDHAATSDPVPQPLADRVLTRSLSSTSLRECWRTPPSTIFVGSSSGSCGSPSPGPSRQHPRHGRQGLPPSHPVLVEKCTWSEETRRVAAMSAVANAGAHKPRLTGVTEITCSSSSRHFDRFAMTQC